MAFPMAKKKHHPPVHHSEMKRKLSVYEKSLSRLGECVAKLGSGRKADAEQIFFELVRQFFTDFIPIHYKFTYEELRAEIEKKHLAADVKIKVGAFLEKISDAEYHPDGVTAEQLSSYLLNFGEIAELLKEEIQQIAASEHAVAPPWETTLGNILHPASSPDHQIAQLLSAGERKAATNDVMGARQTYEEINKLFASLPEQQKESIYPKIMDFYHKLVALS